MILAFLCWFVFVVCVFLITTSNITAEIFIILLHGKQSKISQTKQQYYTPALPHTNPAPQQTKKLASVSWSIKQNNNQGPTSKSYKWDHIS